MNRPFIYLSHTYQVDLFMTLHFIMEHKQKLEIGAKVFILSFFISFFFPRKGCSIAVSRQCFIEFRIYIQNVNGKIVLHEKRTTRKKHRKI